MQSSGKKCYRWKTADPLNPFKITVQEGNYDPGDAREIYEPEGAVMPNPQNEDFISLNVNKEVTYRGRIKLAKPQNALSFSLNSLHN